MYANEIACKITISHFPMVEFLIVQVSYVIVKGDHTMKLRCCYYIYLIHARKLLSHRLAEKNDGSSFITACACLNFANISSLIQLN